MKKEDKWIQDMRKCLEDYSEPLPSHLWEKLEKELSAPKAIPMWRRWQVAAAVLALAVSSLTVWFWYSPSAKYVQHTSVAQQNVLTKKVDKEAAPSLSGTTSIQPDSRTYIAQQSPVSDNTIETFQERVIGNIQGNPTTEQIRKEAEDNETTTSLPPENGKKQEEKQLRQQQRNADRRQMQHNQYLASVRKNTSGKHNWSVGIAAGNTPYSTSSSFGGFGRLDSRSLSTEFLNPTNRVEAAYSQVLLNNREQTTQTDIHHRMPVTVGASVKWNLNKDWALESGLTYTLLSSELHSGSSSYVEEEQRLHYIGIPLKIHRNIWQNKRFSFYASAGGMVEKCVSGKRETVYAYGVNKNEKETQSLDIDPLQWSVMAAVGAQVNFTKQLGLYVEPGMAYYFDDRSSIETIRKQHPFNFNLQLGLRFSFAK